MLFELLALTSSVMFLVSSVASAKHASAGVGGYALAAGIGLALGLCNEWAMRKLGRAASDYSRKYSEKLRISSIEWRLRALYLAAFVWIAVAALLGDRVASVAIRLVG